MEIPKYLMVSTQALPEVFYKVVYAKKLIAQGKAKNSSQAALMAGISRSAFYKYKDSVFVYDSRMSDNIVTFSIFLEDEPGVLSSVINHLSAVGANILTVNQNIPMDGVAPVSISIRMNDVTVNEDELTDALASIGGVVSVKKVSAH